MTQRILNELIAYNESGVYPWHMPGHKRRMDTIFPEVNPFEIDVTEVGSLDELHSPEGVIRETLERTAQIYGSHRSYFLVNGSTAGILAAISAVCRPGDTLIVARNCHKSVYNAIRLLHLKPVYVMPEWNVGLELFGGVSPEQIECVIAQHQEAVAVVLVSPTYEGVCSDIRCIADIAHRAGLPLVVDAAHGAHFEYMQGDAPYPAIRLGADLVVESLHKTLPAMTQCAVLHEKSNLVSSERLEEFVSLYQSTSPSYVFMATMEACIEKMNAGRKSLCLPYQKRLSVYRKRFSQLVNIRLVEAGDFETLAGCGYDEGKLVFSVKDCWIKRAFWAEVECLRSGENIEPEPLQLAKNTEAIKNVQTENEWLELTGTMLGALLAGKYGHMMEMAGGSYVIAMTSVADETDAFETLYQALKSIDQQLMKQQKRTDTILYRAIPEQNMDIAQARECAGEYVPLADAAGRISREFIYAYPPGIPIVTPGEVLSECMIQGIGQCLQRQLNMKGIVKTENGTEISVIQNG